MRDSVFEKLLAKALFYLKFRPRSSFEIRQYLLKKIKKMKLGDLEDINKVINHLKEIDLINDKKFIRWFVDQRCLNKPKSLLAIKQELKRFGFKKNIIDEFFLNYFLDEEKLALSALKKRWLRFSSLSLEKKKEKATQFLLRRGFSFEIIKSVIDKLIKKE